MLRTTKSTSEQATTAPSTPGQNTAGQGDADQGGIGQDAALTAAVVLAGPALIGCAQLIREGARAPGAVESSTLIEEVQSTLSSGTLRGAEQLLGLAAAAAGALLSLFAALALTAAVLHAVLSRQDRGDSTSGDAAHRRPIGRAAPVPGTARGRAALVQLSPAFMRRLCAAALGTGLTLLGTTAGAAPEAPAQPPAPVSALFPGHDPSAPAPETAADDTAATDPENTSTPDEETTMTPLFRPTSPEGSDRWGHAPQRDVEEAEEIVVRDGDSLWGIVAEHLGSEATDWEVAREWPAWHRANEDIIGSDPSLLTPGMVLTAPPED